MSDLPDHRYPPGGTIPGVASDAAEFQEQVRGYLRHRRAQGNAYVSATQVVNEFDITPQRAGKVLKELAGNGALDIWKDTAKSTTTYRILLEQDGGRDD